MINKEKGFLLLGLIILRFWN